MDEKEFIAIIEERIEGKWQSSFENPPQYLHFFKPLNEDDKGKVIIANSPDFVENRQELKYEVIVVDFKNSLVYLNLIVDTSEQVIQYKIYSFNSQSDMHLDDSKGQQFHYVRSPNHQIAVE